MQFTREEFNTMVQEVLYTVPSRFDTLCQMAEITLRPLVTSWCKNEDVLKNRGLEEDLMQSIKLHLMKIVVHGFLRNDRSEGTYNDNPEGFAHWMCKVAKNYKRDYVNKLRNEGYRIDPNEPSEDIVAPASDWAKRQEQLQGLRYAFNVVLSSDIKVYKVLTWLAQVIFVVDKDMKHHKANALIVTVFENKTLNEMYHMLLTAADRVPWMTITQEQHRRIMTALCQPWDEELTYGEMPYSTFFMKCRGEVAAKKSVSDWINRVNGMVRRRAEAEKSATETATSSTGKKRRDEDGSSDIG